MKIFLSYGSEHRSEAEAIAIGLRNRNHTVFVDRADLKPGKEYDGAIEEAIGASDGMIFLLSRASIAAGRYTLTELKIAERTWPSPNGRVLPVLLEDLPYSQIPRYLRGVSILEPHGNIAAEVANAVEEMRRLRSKRTKTVTVVAGAGALVAIAAASVWFFRDPLSTDQIMKVDIDETFPVDPARVSMPYPALGRAFMCKGMGLDVFNKTKESVTVVIGDLRSDTGPAQTIPAFEAVHLRFSKERPVLYDTRKRFKIEVEAINCS